MIAIFVLKHARMVYFSGNVNISRIFLKMFISPKLVSYYFKEKIKKIKGLLKIESSDDVFTCPMN